MSDVSIVDYRPAPGLDTELAELAYAAVRGWPDQRPITASLVRSYLRPTGTTATTLILRRDAEERLVAAAAIRWPATLEATGKLWGPLVHPSAQGGGVGAAVLAAVAQIVAAHPGVRMTTAEIPEARTAGWSLFERAGWIGSGSSSLLKRALPAEQVPAGVAVRTVRPGEYLDQELATLVAAARPDVGHATARDTYSRWTADARYTSDGLLLVDGADGLLGCALVYPSKPRASGRDLLGRAMVDSAVGDGNEPPEVLLAELITSPRLDTAATESVRAALVGAALHLGAATGAVVARAVVDDPGLAATLLGAGFQVVDQIRYYTPPTGVPVLAGSSALAA